MNHARMTFDGLDHFLRELGALPEQLRRDGLEIIRDETTGAAVEMGQQYARGSTGTLARRIRVSFPSTSILVGLVLSAAPHSHLYEFGTQPRKTERGWNRGSMPAKAVTVPIARRRRARMARRLVELLRRHGFKVGDQ